MQAFSIFIPNLLLRHKPDNVFPITQESEKDIREGCGYRQKPTREIQPEAYDVSLELPHQPENVRPHIFQKKKVLHNGQKQS